MTTITWQSSRFMMSTKITITTFDHHLTKLQIKNSNKIWKSKICEERPSLDWHHSSKPLWHFTWSQRHSKFASYFISFSLFHFSLGGGWAEKFSAYTKPHLLSPKARLEPKCNIQKWDFTQTCKHKTTIHLQYIDPSYWY